WLTSPRQCASGHCHGSSLVMSFMMVLPLYFVSFSPCGRRWLRQPSAAVRRTKEADASHRLWRRMRGLHPRTREAVESAERDPSPGSYLRCDPTSPTRGEVK